MTTRDEAVLLATQHIAMPFGRDGDTERYDCLGCDWKTSDIGAADARFGEHMADVLAAAGLLRPDPTGEDREALIEALDDAGLLMNRVETPGAEPETYILEVGVDHAVDAILGAGFARPRNPVTEAPAVTPEQVWEVAEHLAYERWPEQTVQDDPELIDVCVRELTKLLTALGIEVRGGRDWCSFCDEVRDDLSTGDGVKACADCRGEAEVRGGEPA